jgi:uncharacterized protein (DUF1810 family)
MTLNPSLQRFVIAQDARGGTYDQALEELKRGRKESHWMWFVFPQIAGLGESQMSKTYAIQDLAEARTYLEHPVLGPRLRECARVVASSAATSAVELLGSIDAQKLRSSMTLFHLAEPVEPVFQEVLDRYFEGVVDPLTEQLVRAV